MADIAVTIKVDFNLLPELIERTRDQIELVVKKTTLDVQAAAVAMAPVDTGFLKNSLSHKWPSYKTGIITVGAYYGIYVEFGTVHTRAQPFLAPAMERHRASFLAAIAVALEEAARGS